MRTGSFRAPGPLPKLAAMKIPSAIPVVGGQHVNAPWDPRTRAARRLDAGRAPPDSSPDNPLPTPRAHQLRQRVTALLPHVGAKLPPVRPSVSAEQLQPLLTRAAESHQPLAAVLAEAGFGSTLKGLTLSGQSASLQGQDLSGLRFERCHFDGVSLAAARINGTQFERCRFDHNSLADAQLSGSRFSDCTFREALFVNASLGHVRFEDCHLAGSSFEDASLREGTTFLRSVLPGTHFLGADVVDARIQQSRLRDTLFFGQDKHFTIDEASRATWRVTKPTTATLVSAHSRGVSVPLVGEKIAGVADTLPVRVAMQASTLSAAAVDAEVDRLLDHVAKHARVTGLSPAQALVQEVTEHPHDWRQVAPIVAKARALAEQVDSVVLPGGEDVAPRLYGAQQAPQTDFKGDYRRSLLELGLIHHSFQRGVPLLAICRGFQMTSVYFGAQLHQHIDPQVGVRAIGDPNNGETPAPHSLFGDRLERIRAAVYHHQAVPDNGAIGPHLQASLQRAVPKTEGDLAPGEPRTWQVVMAFESAQVGAPLMGFQFHPEFFDRLRQSPESAGLSNEQLIALAKAYQRPGADQPGLRDPTDMIASGILEHMSAGNDALWRVLSDAAGAHRAKAGIRPENLRCGRNALHPAVAG